MNIQSILQRLKSLATKRNKAVDATRNIYVRERLLYRVAQSTYKDFFILKGGSLIYVWDKDDARPTRDIDFLAQSIQNDEYTLKNIFTEIVSISCPEDGIFFKKEDITTSIIRKQNHDTGIRICLKAYFGDTRSHENIQIDIGFGDPVVNIAMVTYPILLEDMPIPKILTYSVESLIAEKFEAMIRFGESNGRMKDFYDISKLLSENHYKKELLAEAIKETFHYRQTSYQDQVDIFLLDFCKKKEKEWSRFIAENKFENLSLESVLSTIKKHLQPIYEEIRPNS